MRRLFSIMTLLFLFGINFAFSQLPPRDLGQIRRETSDRNRAIENYDRNNIGRNMIFRTNRRLYPNGQIPGSEIRKYVLAALAETEVKVLKIGSGDTLLVDDGVNKVTVRILGIDAPEDGQPFFEESKKVLIDLAAGKKVVLKYSLHNLKDELGYFPARVFIGDTDVGLKILENGFAWYKKDDKFFFEKTDDKKNESTAAKAQTAKTGIWQDEKPQKPWVYREKKSREREKLKEKTAKN